MQQPVTDLDGIDEPRGGTELNEGGTRRDADIVERREHLGAVEKHTIDGRVQVARDGEVDGEGGADVETEPLDARGVAELGTLWHRQSSGGDPVEGHHLMVARDKDLRERTQQVLGVKLSRRHACRQSLMTGEGTIAGGFGDTGTWRHLASPVPLTV